MLKHVVLITLKDLCFGPQLENIKNEIKTGMEQLNGQIPGLIELKVYPQCLNASTADVVMEILFEDEKAFKDYSVNPLTTAAEKNSIIPYQNDIAVADFFVE